MIPQAIRRLSLQFLLLIPALPIPWPSTTAGRGWTEGGAEPTLLVLWHGLVVVLIIAGLLDSRPRAGLPTAIAWAFVLVLGVMGWSALIAPYRFAAALVVVEFAVFAAIVWLVAREGESGLRALALPLGLVGIAQVVLAFGQRIAGDARPAGSFLNPNHLAAWLVAVALIGLAGASDDGTSRRGRWLRFGLAVAAICGIGLTGSRGAGVGLVLGAAALVALIGPRMTPTVRRRCAIGVTLLALIATTVIVWRLQERDPFRYHRVRIWHASITMLLERPWTGSGPGQFAIETDRVRFDDGEPPLRFDKRFSTPHSDLLRVWVEFGLLGGAAIAGMCFLVARQAWLQRVQGQSRTARAGIAAALVAWVGQAAVEDLSACPAIYVLGAAMVGSLVFREPYMRRSASLRFRLSVAFLLLPLFVIGDLAPYLGWRTLVRGESPDRARTLIPLSADAWSATVTAALNDKAPWTLDRYADARRAAEQGVAVGPNRSAAWRELARVEAAGCRMLFRDAASRERARQAYLSAESRAPFDASLPLELAAFLLDTADATGAMNAAERARVLEPEAVAPRLLLAASLTEMPGAPDARRIRRLLDELDQSARAWSDYPFETPYEIGMMRPAPARVQRIEARLRSASSP